MKSKYPKLVLLKTTDSFVNVNVVNNCINSRMPQIPNRVCSVWTALATKLLYFNGVSLTKMCYRQIILLTYKIHNDTKVNQSIAQRSNKGMFFTRTSVIHDASLDLNTDNCRTASEDEQ